jgi:mono/diheme cytochrome c family protein
MPPFAHVLNDAEIAAVLSYVRGAWGNEAAPISSLEVQQYRAGRNR